MLRQVLVHFEHGALVGSKDLPQLVVSKNFPLIIRVLQVVLANMVPHLRNDFATRQRARTHNRGEIRRRGYGAGKSATCFTTSPFCHLALLLFCAHGRARFPSVRKRESGPKMVNSLIS